MKARRLTSEILETRRLLAANCSELPNEGTTIQDAPAALVGQTFHSTAVPAVFATTRVLDPPSGVREIVPNNSGFHIEIVPGLSLRGQPAALAAVHRAADQWEAMFFDPITVTIHVDFVTPSEVGDSSILGLAAPVSIELPYAEVRAAMQADGLIEGDDDIVGRLPDADTIDFAYPAGVSSGNNISVPKANAKALGLRSRAVDDVVGVSDGRILLNNTSNTAGAGRFDFDNQDGIEAGLFDFESIVVHEIGHILGFVSATDQIDTVGSAGTTISPTPLDLFRFRSLVGPDNPRTPAAFESIRRELRPSTPAVLDFIMESGWTDVGVEHPVELGVDAGLIDPGSDFGYQASHWQAEDLFGETIGVMVPTLAPQTVNPISNVDLRAFDLIGFDILPPGVAASAPTLSDDQVDIDGVDRIVIDILANDQNNAEALDLSTFRLVEPPVLGTAAFDPVSGLLVYEPEPVTTDDLDAFTYTIADSRGLFARPAVVEVNITGRGIAPIAVDDFVLTRRDQSVTFNPVVNDTDADNELSIENLVVTSGPNSGTVQREGQNLVYTPNAGFEGSDQLTYSITDSRGNVATATIEITVGATLGPVVIPGTPLTLLQRADTNGDLRITPFDALNTLNYLSQHAREVPGTELDDEGRRLDVDDNGVVSPFDALIVLNLLNQQQTAGIPALVLTEPLDDGDDEDELLLLLDQ